MMELQIHPQIHGFLIYAVLHQGYLPSLALDLLVMAQQSAALTDHQLVRQLLEVRLGHRMRRLVLLALVLAARRPLAPDPCLDQDTSSAVKASSHMDMAS
jgi:hypothetical protein